MIMKCIYCNKPFKSRVRNQKTCGGEECKKQLNRDLGKIWQKKKTAASVKEKPPETIKKQFVCKGCKYYTKFYGDNICDYASQNNRCRSLIEKANGGIKTDTCVCYKK